MWDFVGQVIAEYLGDGFLKSLGRQLATGGGLTYVLLALVVMAIVVAYAFLTHFTPFSIIALIAVAGVGVLYAGTL